MRRTRLGGVVDHNVGAHYSLRGFPAMRSFRLLLPSINIAVFVLVAIAFVSAHGGLHGDAGAPGPGTTPSLLPETKD